MQREEEYRQRLHVVNSEVKKMLDYHVCYYITISPHTHTHIISCIYTRTLAQPLTHTHTRTPSLTHTHTHTLKVDVEAAIRKHEQQQLIKWLTAQVMETVKSKKVYCEFVSH